MIKRSNTSDMTMGLLFVFAMITAIYFIRVSQVYPNMTERGQFGDMFGALNTVFSGVALIGVVVTLWKQHHMQVETTFFSMLTLLQEISASSVFEIENSVGENPKYTGRAYFKFAFEDFSNRYYADVVTTNRNLFPTGYTMTKDQKKSVANIPEEVSKAPLIKCYEDMYDYHEYNLGHFFRYIYNIIKYLRENYPEDMEKQKLYVGILQAQLSNDEMALLFYNAISIHGKNAEGVDVFRKWLDEYGFFENIGKRCIFHPSFANYYPNTKFKCLTRQV